MNGSIFSDIIAVLYLAAFIAAGQLLSRWVFCRSPRVVRTTLGAALSLLMLMWLPALFSFGLGFTLLSQLLALAVAAATGFISAKKAVKPLMAVREPELRPYLCCVIPTVLLLCGLTLSHTLPHMPDGGLGSRQGFFPPEYSIMAGQPMSYPFLCDSVSSTFYTLGASLRLSYILPMIPAFFSVASGVYLFFEDWFKRADKAVLAFVLFFIGGGFGFAYFMDDLRVLQLYPHIYRVL